jgi:enoyl-CoA hydratase
MSASTNVLCDIQQRVALVTINRPDKRNALDGPTRARLLEILDELAANTEVRAVVLTGAGDKAFVAGADIAEFEGRSPIDQFRVMSGRTIFDAVEAFPKPVIAALNGFTLGGGCELAMACDIILAADTAVFGQPEITLGIMPGNGGTQRLTRAVGKAKAMELCLTGRRICAAEAERSNLVSRVVPAEELLDEALKVADKIANLSQHAVMMIKEAINRGFATTLAEGSRFERGQFYSLFATEDQKEGMAAFIEKRKPEFKNR